MGNQVNQYCTVCTHCNSSEQQNFRPETRYVQVQGCFKHPIRCRKFYISSDSLHTHKISEFIIFTDESLNMFIPNETIKLQVEQTEKLEETLNCQLKNNNLIIKDACFVLKAIQQQSDDQFAEFKDFPQPELESGIQKQKKKEQIEKFQLRKKCRAFKFKNPLRKYNIATITVVILPMYKSQSDLLIVKQGLQQAFLLADDSKSIGVAEISFMLGYQQSTFQKIVIQYMLCLTKPTTREYYFKRFSECVYLTHDSQCLELFFKFLNIYINSVKVKRLLSNETLVTEPSSISKYRKLGPHYASINLNAKQRKIVSESLIQNKNIPIFTKFDRQKITSQNGESNNNGQNDFSQIFSSDDSELKHLKLRSLKSKGSSVSDYF